MKWEKVKLQDICVHIVSGGTPLSTREDYYFPKEVPWLKTKEVNYKRIYETEHYISVLGLNNSSAKIVPVNSVIVAMYGQGDTAGRVAINKMPVSTNQACCNLIVDKEKADYNFIFYLLSTCYEKLVSLKNGGAQPNLNVGLLKEFEVFLPDLQTQNKISSILSAYDDLIENNQKQIKLLEEAAQRLYKEWFVDLRFPGHEDVEIIDGVPVGWEWKKLSELGMVITGKTPATSNEGYYGGDVPFVKIPDMHNKIFPLNVETYLSNDGANSQKGKYLPPKTLLISCIGTVGLINITVECCQTNQQINALVLNNEKMLHYMYYNLKGLQGLLQGLGSNGATMTNVSKNKIESILIKIPRYDLLEKFYDVCNPIFDKILLLSKENIALQEARDRLLPKLMSGEVEV